MGIMDLRAKKPSGSGEETTSENQKFCTDCKTTKTPLWRGGPAGPKSLCNACGIRYRKKRRALLGMNKGLEKNKKTKKKEMSDSSQPHTSSNANTNDDGEDKLNGNFNGLSKSVKVRLYALGCEVLLQSSSSALSGVVKKQRCQRRRKLGEEEQAAISLMALSCGSVFA